MYRGKKIGVVVPAYNEKLLIGETLSSMPEYVDRIYAVDDKSTDQTLSIIEEFAEKNPKIMPVKHEMNGGVGAAIVSGYKKSLEEEIDITAVMAGDNQMDPAYLPNFLDPIVDDLADYAKGNRLISPEFRQGMSKWRLLGNSILTFLTKIATGYWQIVDPQNGYTAISRKALLQVDLKSIYPWYGYCNNILARMNVKGLRVANISHPAKYGREKSKIRYRKYIVRVSCLLLMDFLWRLKTKYIFTSFHPLVLFYLFGGALTFVGSMGGLYSIYYKFILYGPIFEKAVLSLITFVIGLQFTLFAMLFDMQLNRHQDVLISPKDSGVF